MTVTERIAHLSQVLNQASQSYYAGGEQQMTDKDFDMAMKELESLESAHPELRLPDSPTQRVGSDLTAGFEKVTHKYPMLSIANSYSMDEVGAFMRSVQEELQEPVSFTWELKIDGASMAVTYRDGKLLRGATRGDGATGDDVTESTKTIADIPMVILLQGELEVRGECYMEKAQFERIVSYQQEHGQKVFVNARNATAGSLKTKNVKEVARRGLRFRAFGIASKHPDVTNHLEAMQLVTSQGFKGVNVPLLLKNMEEFQENVKKIQQARERLPFGIDGIVVKVLNLAQRERLGVTGKCVRWATAYKFDSEQARTKVLEVVFQTGRTGKIVPVANLEPVLLMDSTVRRATLHNFDEIGRLGLRVGDYVFLEKGGDIIPKVVGVDESARDSTSVPIETPSVCPACGAPLEKREGMLVDMFCSNRADCPAQFLNSLTYFVARDCMNIMNLGEAMLEKLVDNGSLKTVLDIYKLMPIHFEGIQGAGPKVVGKILDNIDASKTAVPARLLTAMGISQLGKGTAQKLMGAFGGWQNLWTATEEDISKVPDVGAVVAANFCSWRSRNLQFLGYLVNEGFRLDSPKQASAGGALAGEVAVVTGTLPNLGREECEELLRTHGARVTGSVSSKTTLLILGAEPGSKLQKAESMGIKIWTEVVLLEHLEG